MVELGSSSMRRTPVNGLCQCGPRHSMQTLAGAAWAAFKIPKRRTAPAEATASEKGGRRTEEENGGEGGAQEVQSSKTPKKNFQGHTRLFLPEAALLKV